MTQNKALKCDHSCDCCEILCSDAIKKHNENLESQTERIAKLEKENAELKKKLEDAVEVIKKVTPIVKDSIWSSHPEEDHLYEFKKNFLKRNEL